MDRVKTKINKNKKQQSDTLTIVSYNPNGFERNRKDFEMMRGIDPDMILI